MDYKKYSDYMHSIDQSVINKAKSIKLLILDVDGVMTDGGIILSDTNSESKKFFAQDGHGIMIIRELGIEVAIISGRYSKAVEYRGKELGFTTIIQSSRNKLLDYEKNFSNKYSLKDVCFVGDDIVDIGLLKSAGLSITVPNANYNGLLKYSDWVTPRKGGKGAVRDVCDLICLAKNKNEIS
mgnify:CR=1 FL=1